MCGIWNTDVMARDKSMENGTVNNRITSEKEFEEVFRYYYRPLFLFAYGYVMDEGEAENIVQSVFTEMWEKRKNLPENLNLRAYLYSSVKHACLRYFSVCNFWMNTKSGKLKLWFCLLQMMILKMIEN